MDNIIITIGREFGSGGKYIGERLAEELGIKFYDKELIERVSKESNISVNVLEKLDEKRDGSFWSNLALSAFSTMDSVNSLVEMPFNEKYFIEQANVIEKIGETESCVIIGRCSNIILRDNKNAVHIFLYASNMDFKVKRKMKYEGIDEKKAKHLIHKTDKERAAYYNYFTNETWGDKSGYDLCIDTSKIGVEKTVEMIKEYVKLKRDGESCQKA